MKAELVEVRRPSWVWRAWTTLVVVVVMSVAIQGYNAVSGSIEGEVAVKQLSGDPTERAIGRAVAQANIPALAWTVIGFGLLGVWVPYAYGIVRYTQAKERNEVPS